MMRSLCSRSFCSFASLFNHFIYLTLFSISLASCQPSGIEKKETNKDSSLQESYSLNEDDWNDPKWLSIDAESFYDRPKQSRLQDAPWSGHYWGTSKAQIAGRWQKNYEQATMPTRWQLKNMSFSELETLSPAEKFDIQMGRYDYPLTNYMIQYKKTLSDQGKLFGWSGICNGWAGAAIDEKEPRHVVKVRNRDGIQLTYFPGDVKGLISQFYILGLANSIGFSCQSKDIATDQDGRPVDQKCRDVNPGSFHLAITQRINENKGLVFDRDPKEQVWNHPISGYEFIHGTPYSVPFSYKHAAPGTAYLVDVKMTLEYVTFRHPERVAFDSPKIFTNLYSYTLELDSSKKIIGGEWDRNTAAYQPDFIWGITKSPFDVTLEDISLDYLKDLYRVMSPYKSELRSLLTAAQTGEGNLPTPDPRPQPDPTPDPLPDPTPVPRPDPTPDPRPRPDNTPKVQLRLSETYCQQGPGNCEYHIKVRFTKGRSGSFEIRTVHDEYISRSLSNYRLPVLKAESGDRFMTLEIKETRTRDQHSLTIPLETRSHPYELKGWRGVFEAKFYVDVR